MIAILAPAKKMNFDLPALNLNGEKQPLFMEKTQSIIDRISSLDKTDISTLMKVSPAIAEETHKKFADFSSGLETKRLRSSIFVFKGETYKGLDAERLSTEDIFYSENKLRILSGLYGILSPLTLIEPYRFEMGLKFDLDGHKKISDFWKTMVSKELNRLLQKNDEKFIIDLASTEYTAAVDKKGIKGSIVDIVFREERNGTLKSISTFSKKARGMMARYIVQERIEKHENLKNFKKDNYCFDSGLSNSSCFVFVR